MIDTDKWMASARVSLDELEKEIKRLREGRLELINEVVRIIKREYRWMNWRRKSSGCVKE